MNQERRRSSKNASRSELLAVSALTYPTALVLANLAIAVTTYAHIDKARNFAREDELSRHTSEVASIVAGYDVSVACADESLLDQTYDTETERLGQVNRYQYVNLFLDIKTVAFNHRSMLLRASVCRDILNDVGSNDTIEQRQDNFLAYATMLHELVHLEDTTLDETATQCQAIDRLPASLQKIGFSEEDAHSAAAIADNQARYLLTPEYHQYPC